MTHDTPRHESAHESVSCRVADPLAARLRDWRRRQDARHDLAPLATRVAEAVRGDAAIAPVTTLPPLHRWSDRAAWFAAGLAAAVAVAWIAWPARENDAAADWPPSVRLAAGHLAAKAVLVAGMEDTFGDGLAWIAEHDQRVDVGLVPGGTGGSRPFAMRIIVLTRRTGAATWRPAWHSDVVTRDEQLVDVAAGSDGSGRLRLWAHALPDGGFAIDGELRLADTAVPVEASYSGVLRPGEPRRVTGHRAHDVEWQIIQTVVPLDPGGRSRGDVG